MVFIKLDPEICVCCPTDPCRKNMSESEVEEYFAHADKTNDMLTEKRNLHLTGIVSVSDRG
jgi:hypothetical protein